MKCPRCQHENPPGANFCNACGARLELSCAGCGHTNPAASRFCNRCGQPFDGSQLGRPEPIAPERGSARDPASPAATVRPVGPERSLAAYTPRHLADKILQDRSALEGERRQVTVLFADIVGYASLAERLDPEDVHRIIDRCFELITAEVHRLEGTINQYTGDGVMALFGAPIAHEDSPRRAVHAALGIQRVLRDYDREVQEKIGAPLRMRIGINAGPVVVGKIGDDLRMDYTAVGDTTNVAARLQQAARPSSVLVSAATHRLIAGYFDTLDLGELAVKGHAPVHAFEVLRARGRRARLDVAAERGLTPLVGRERQLAVMIDLFERVKQGHGQVVCIAGDAGIGKSRLVYELRRSLVERGEDATWLEGRCLSFGQSMPLLPVVEQLRENFGIEEIDGEPEVIAKVEHGMRRMGHLEPHIPYVRYLLSVDPGDPGVVAMDASVRRRKVFEAGLALCLRGAFRRPIVFVFEDLHWIDDSTHEYLTLLVDSLPTARIMLVLTYRLGYRPSWGTRSFQTTLMLDSLSEAETLTMAGRVLGIEQFPPELQAALMAKAEGVPLFVEEVTKTLLDIGVLRRENASYRLLKNIDQINVPDTIQGIIMARLDRLGEDGKRTVQLASVIGRQFLRRLLERIAGLKGELEGLLGELKALEIIYEQGLLAEPAYVFKHAVIQDVAYQSLLVQRRKELHRAVGLAIEELYVDRLTEHYAELAHHFSQAEEWAKATHYSDLAGDRAAHAFATAEARRHYVQALGCAGRMIPAPDPRVLATLHGKYASVLLTTGDYESAAAESLQAIQLVRRGGHPGEETELLVQHSWAHLQGHRPEAALDSIDQALTLARQLGNRELQGFCLASRVTIRAAGRGEVRESVADAEEALELVRDIKNPRRRAQALSGLGTVYQWRGELERAALCLSEAADLAEREHAGLQLGLAAFSLGHVHVSRGAYEEGLRWYRRLADYAATAADAMFLSRAPNIIGGVHLELYDLDEALRLCVEGEEASRRLFPWPEPRGHSLLKAGLASFLRGEHGAADDFYRRAWDLLEFDEWIRWRWHIPLLHARGQLALAENHLDEAWSYATRSLEMATGCDAPKHAARAQRLQGEILMASGRLQEAEQPLVASVSLAEALGTPREAWLGRAALGRVLARLGRDPDAEAAFVGAAQTIETIAARLTTPRLRESFLGAEPVVDVFRLLGRMPPRP